MCNNYHLESKHGSLLPKRLQVYYTSSIDSYTHLSLEVPNNNSTVVTVKTIVATIAGADTPDTTLPAQNV